MILSYETVKYVSIQDSRLGLLRYLLMLLILIYVGFIEMYANGGYLFSDTIHGVLRFTVQQPTINNCDPFNETSSSSCENNFFPLRELSYCQQQQQQQQRHKPNTLNDSNSYNGNIYPCQYYEAINAQIITETSVTIITRAKQLNQTFLCGDGDDAENSRGSGSRDDTCPHTYQTVLPSTTNTTNATTIIPFYVAQSEAFTILMDHAVTATKLCSMSSASSSYSASMSYACSTSSSHREESHGSSIQSGRLFTTNLELCQQYTSYPTSRSSSGIPTSTSNIATAPCYIEPNVTDNHFDYFSMDVLIRAAGINSLDDCIDGSSKKCTTYRESGATLMVHVIWNDFIPYRGMVKPYYFYRVQLINQSYKTYIPYYHSYFRQGGRTLLIAHGIRFVFVLGGEFHTFHMTTFLITLTTALGLFAVATTIIDYLMIYILPEKEKYTKAKYEATSVLNPLEIPNSIVPTFINQSLNSRMSAIAEPDGNNSLPANTPSSNEDETLLDPLLANS